MKHDPLKPRSMDPKSADGGPVCPGVPQNCEHSQALISRVLEGMLDPMAVTGAKGELAHCSPCLHEIDMQVRFKVAMAQQGTQKAPPALQLRISESLGRVDLSNIDVTDL